MSLSVCIGTKSIPGLTIFNTTRLSAARFLDDLKPFFRKISGLNEKISLANPTMHEKIRIAVLDSGVDDSDPKIRPAIKFGRINTGKIKSFVGRPNEWQDTHGHGTHVTRLLLETAPAAEIYVAKICTGKLINDEFMPGIAKVGLNLPLSHNRAVRRINADMSLCRR